MEIRQGYKQTEVGIIPKEWEVKKLGECFEFLSTNSYSREKMTYEEQEYMNIHYGDIHMKYGATLDIEKMKGKIPYIKAEETLPKKIILVEEGDLLVADASEDYKDIGKSTEILNIKDNKVLGGLHTLLLRDKNNSFANGYKGYILRNEKILKEVKRIATGISVLGISKTNLSELNILIPPLKEQEKIAEILSNYDKAIEQEELLIEKEKEFKKGMMQKIFSQEIRFKDDNGEDYPEWEEKKLEEFAFIFIGLVTTMTSNYVEKGVPLIRNSDIFSNKIRDKKELIKLNSVFVEQNKNRVFQEGDIVTVHTGDLGTSAIITKDLEGSIGFATLNTRILNKKYCNNLYLSHFLNSKKYKKYITRVKTGDGRDNLNLKDFVKSLIPIPPLKEQEKIANFLSNIDKKIELLENKLELLKNEKKGMMQKLLIGEVRV